MSTHIEAAFTFDRWDTEPLLDEPGASFSRTSMAKKFTGDLVGTSIGELLMAGANDGSVAYSGFEWIQASFDGLSGGFTLCHNAFGTATGGTLDLKIMDSSGTGDLVGITGTPSITRHDDGTHTFTLDYDLPAGAASSATGNE